MKIDLHRRSPLARLIAFVGALLLAAAPASACPDIDGLVDINCDRQLVIVCFGDSITFGRADEPEEIGYPGRLNRYFPNAIVYNLGKPGEKTPNGLSRAGREFPAIGNIDYAIVLEGVNDFFIEPQSSVKTRNNVLGIVNRAANQGAVTLLGNLTDVRRDSQRGWVRSVNRQINPFRQIDFFSLGDNIISGDLLHPGPFGYDQMADLVFRELYIRSEANRPADSDGDDVYDFAEARFGTDPFNPDSDGDGLLDGVELFTYGSNPLALDSDGDGFTDPQEVNEIGSNPADPRPGAPSLRNLEILAP